MRRVLLFSAFVLCLTANVTAQSSKTALKAPTAQPAATTSPSPAAAEAARASFAKLPLSFEENVGQTDDRVKYMSRGSDYNLFLTADQAVFTLRDGSTAPNCAGLNRRINPDCAHPSDRRPEQSVLWLKMTGANASAQILGSGLLPGKINYYVGNDPSKWRTGVRQFGRVSYRGIYPGVDLTYYGNQQQLESDFVVAPGANPKSIQFEVKGARETRIDAQGNLVLASDFGAVRLLRPVVYQVVKGTKHDVSGRYILLAENRVGFEIGKYDAHEPLVIDPTFVYSTYLGGGTLFSGGDQGLAIAIDAAGAAYVTGTGSSSDFPGSALSGPVAQASPFAFVTKFDPTGGTLVYSSLLRGTTGFNDTGNGIGVDSSGNAYVDGVTGDSDFPLLNPFQATIGDVFSAGFNFIQSGFVAGLDGNGLLIYSTYFGGRNAGDQNTLSGLAVDANGNAYVVGDTNSNNFPTVNPFQATSNVASFGSNAVVAKFNPQGQPIYSTYLGGGGQDVGHAIAIDSNGNAYVTGQTSSNAMFETGFPVQSSPAPFQGAINGFANAFVAKFSFTSPNLTLANSTYLGGSGSDEAFGIAVDNATPPNVYLTGQTNSKTGTPFPTMNPIFGPSASTTSEAFVTKLKGDFTALVYSTFLGGTGAADGSTGDIGYDIALDGATPPNAFVAGSTASTDFPIAHPLQSTLSVMTNGTNAFMTEVNGTGAAPLTFSTYLGGRGNDLARGIAVDSAGNAYLTGTTTSTNFPVSGSGATAPYQGELHTSSGNAFVTKISSAAAASALNFFPPFFNFHDQGIGQPSQPESVTLSNNTASAVTINVGGITFTGANAGDFTQTNTCPVSPATLAVGASCTISVVFNPTDQDSRTAQLNVASSAPPATMNLSGFGAVPEVSLSTTSINFGTNDPLNVVVTNFISITNNGGAPLHVDNAEITGPDASAFAISFNSCAAVPVPANGGSCFLEPTFLPTTAGHAYSATLLINDDAAGSPQSVSLTGTGVAQVIVSPHSLEFGGWLVGTSSHDSQISLLNGSGGNITLTTITPGGSSGDFPIDPNNSTTCVANLVLLPGVSCNLDVFFKPTVGSAFDGRTATYTFNWTGAASSSQAVTVMGTGETGFTLYQNSFTAPPVFVGATESRINFDQVFNGNAFPVTVSSIVLSGANPQDFVVQLDTSCSTNGVVPANSVCFLDGSFSPSAVGVRSVTVTINYNPPSGSSLILNVTGTGLAGPVLFPTAYDMGSQIVNLTGPTQRVVLQNVQKVPLAISAITPPAGSEFAIVNASAQGACKVGAVPGGGNCFFDLTFTPGGTGTRTASITVTDNGPGSPRKLNLTGTGVPAADTISVTPNALDFGNVVLVVAPTIQPTASATFYLINGGTTSTTVSVAPALTTAGTPFAIPTGPGSGTCVLNAVLLPQGGTCSVVVTVKPTTTGKITNSVTLTDSVGGLHTVPIQATGVDQGAMSFGSSPTFNQLPNTTTATPLTTTLTNSGSGPLTITSLYLTGTNSADFAIVPSPATTCAPGTTGVTLTAAPGPGNTCVVALTFAAPNTLGTYRASVSVTANLGNGVSGSTFTSLTGNVVAGGINASPSPINFGTVALGTSIDFSSVNNSNPNNGNFVVLTNNNTTPITIVSIVPQNTGDYTITSFSNSCPVSPSKLSNLQFQNTCTFNVTFAPTVTGAEPANNIVITYNTGGSNTQLLIPLNGTGSNALVAMPNPLNASSIVGGSQSPTVTIGNGSASTVNITGVGAITGAGASNFKVNFEFCTGTALQPTGSAFGTTCQIFLTYSPTAPGTNVPAQLPVMYNVGGPPQTLTVNLNSSATAAQVSIVPSQTPPTPLIFPGQGQNQGINTQSLVLSVLVTNTGNDVLNFTGFKITGTNSNDFALAPQSSNFDSQYPNIMGCSSFGFGNSIQPGQSCTIPITFTPGPPPLPGGTTRNATLTITDNAFPSKTQTVLLEGNSTGGNVTVSPTSLPFPDTNLGSSATQSVLLMNGSSSAVTFSSVSFGTSSYSIDASQTLNACSASKPLSAFTGSCTVYIKFTPALGANPDTATIHTSNGSPTVLLSGTGKSASVTVSPNPLNFTTSQLINTTSSPLTVTLTNGTSGSITISGTPTITGTNAADFAMSSGGTCSGVVASGGGICIVNITFTPKAAGARTATLTITDSPDANSPHLVTLNGTGIQAGASLSSNSIAFGTIPLNATSGKQTVTVTNNGTAPLNISNVQLGGANAGDFSLVTPASGADCRTVGSVAVNGACVVAATFTPTALNARTATITITDDASPTTQTINLTGSGGAPSVAFNPTTIAFGNQRQNTTSVQMTSTLTNAGTVSLTISNVALGGANAGDFTLVAPSAGADCRTVGTVAASSSCVLAATFTPGAIGARSATVTFTDNSSPTTQVLNLSGTGTFPQATPTPSPVAFGNQRQNTTSAGQTLTLTNGGTDTMHISTVVLGGTNANEFAIASGTTCTNASTVVAGANCVVKLTFTPTALGGQAATVTFTDDASPTTQVVNLSGTGTFPQATPTPSPVPFGNQRQNTTSAAQTLTLTNGGTDTLHISTVVLGGTNANQFAIATGTTCTNASTVLAGANCVVKLTFTPTALGGQAATVTFTDDASPTTQVVNLTGTGVFPQASPAPTTVPFGSQANGITSAPLTVTLTNGGTGTLNLTTVALGGTNPGAFAIAAGTTCTNGSMVLAGASCVVKVTFTPTGLTPFSATLTFTDDASPTTQVVNLTGTGVTSTVNFSPSTLAFGNQRDGVASAQMTSVLTNSGATTLTITSVTLTGTNPGDFALATPASGTDCRTVGSVATGGVCTIAATFTPTALGSRSATVSVADSASGSPHSLTLTGTGVFPQATPTPSPVAFGNQMENVTSTAQTLTLTNGGTGTLNLTTVVLGGTNANQFVIASGTTCTNASTVVAGANCVVKLTFTPTALGLQTATVTFTDDASPTTQVVTVTGTGVFPQATPTPSPLGFGNQRENTTSATQTLTLTNGGTGTLNLTTVALGGTNANQFAIVTTGTTCTNGSTVLAGANCVVKVTFTPTALGLQTATITFTDNASPATQVVTVTGTGVFPQAGAAPGTLPFGSQTNGIASAPQTITLTNGGTDVLHITTVALGGTNPSVFAIAAGTTCTNGSMVNPGSSCIVNVTFTPSGLSSFAATLTFTDDASPTTQVVNLTGTGVTSTVNFSPSTVAFGNQRDGVASAQMTSVLTNSGATTLTITSVTLTGTNPGDFALATPASGTDCRTVGSVATGGVCTIAATFTPTALGSRSATVSVADSASGSPHSLTLTGTGVFPQATPTPSPLAFGNQMENVTSAVQTLTLTNGGTGTLNLATVVLGGTNANQFAIATGTTCTNASTVVAGANCVVKLTFTPTALGLQTATVTFTDDASPTTQVVTVTGTGVFPQATPTPSPLGFGNQRENTTSATQTLTLTNGGTGTLNLTTVVLGGTNANQFAIVTTGTTCTNGSTVLAGANCVVKVTFTPTALGLQTATITFTDNASPATQVVTVTGTGVFPQAGAAPGTLPFGSQTNGIASAPQTITLTNGGTDVLHITTVALGGTNPSVFAIAAGTTCTNGSMVNPGSSCIVNVTFTPSGLSSFAATLTFTDDASPTTQVVNLTGTGVTSTVNFSPSTVAFGNQRDGVASTQMTSVLTNSGATTLTITSVTLTGTNPGDFALATPASGTDCRTVGSVATGGVCTIAATFTPTALGSRSATVSVADSAAGSPHSLTLTGTGVFPQATPTPSPLPFVNQIINTTSSALTVTLTNGGTDLLHITTVALGGTNPADFAIATGTTCTNGSTVAAGNTCIVNLTFTPATANPFAATLTFTDDANPTTQTVNLSGTGVTPPTATLSGNSISFGNQRVNLASAAQNVTITNNGGAPLGITSIAITGTNPSDFAFASPATTCPTSASGQVAPASSCTLSVTFDPSAANARSASITITVTGVANPAPVALSGTGTAPVATPSITTVPFGNQEVSTTSAAQNGTLNNTGTDVLHITAVSITGANASDFSIVAAGTSCATGLPTPVSVAATANCTWSVKFTPTALGPRTASLTFTDDSGATPGAMQPVAQTGTGTAPVVLLAPTTLSFPAQALNSTSAAMNGTLTNTGTTVLHLATVTITGANAGDFGIAAGGTTCTNGSTVAPTNGSCTWSVTFTPTAAGTRTATLTFTDDNNGVTGSTQTVALTGITPPAATLSPNTPIAFGNQGVGTASSASTITVTNPGGSTLHISTLAISGTNAGDFAIAATGTTCTNASTVAPAANCVINVTFTPSAAGARGPATLTITDDASPTTQTISLSGTGISFTLSVPTPPASATAGTPITATVQLTPGTGGFPNAVTFSASNLPPDTTASFSQTTLTPGNAVATTMLTLTTQARSGGNSRSTPPSQGPISGGWVATALLALLAMVTMRQGFRMQRIAYLPLAVLLLSAAIITGCTKAATGTPAGSYNVTVTATSGSYSQSTTVAITVK